jgi:DNA-binding NarL/FixJ family response regulator
MLQVAESSKSPNNFDVLDELAMLRSRLYAVLAESARELHIMRDRCELLSATMESLGIWNSRFRARTIARAKISTLSAREIQVLKAIAEGLSTKEIAYRLNITFKTAVSHRTRLMAKLEVHEAAELVRLAIAAGLVPLEA